MTRIPTATSAGARIAATDGPGNGVASPWHLLVLSQFAGRSRPRTEQPNSVTLCRPPPASARLEGENEIYSACDVSHSL